MGDAKGECPICSRHFNQKALESHVNNCLDQQQRQKEDALSMKLVQELEMKLNKQPNNSNAPLRGAIPSHNHPQPSFQQYPPSHIPPNAFPAMPPNPYPGFHTPQMPIGGPRALPAGWEMRRDGEGRSYYIDHNTSQTTYQDPRKSAQLRGWEMKMGQTHKTDRANQQSTHGTPNPQSSQGTSEILLQESMLFDESKTKRVVLTPSRILIFANEKDSEPEGFMSLPNSSVKKEGPLVEIRTARGRKITLRPKQVDMWYDAITAAIFGMTPGSPTINDGWVLLNTKRHARLPKSSIPKTSSGALQLAESDFKWMNELKQHPEDEKALVSGHLNSIFMTPGHRFGSTISKFTDSFQKKYKKKRKDNSDYSVACEDILSFLENTISALENHYPGLFDISSSLPLECHIAVESLVFPRIYPDIFELFKMNYQQEDREMASRMKNFSSVSPAHMGIPKDLWLIPEGKGDARPGLEPPYHMAITILRQLPSHQTPQAKIQCLNLTATTMVKCVDTHWAGKKKILLGGDDFLPLFSFLILKANIPNAMSECHFMETFMDEITSTGEGGYMVVTFQTCLLIIQQLDQKTLQENLKLVMDEEMKKELKEKEQKKGSQSNGQRNGLGANSGANSAPPTPSTPSIDEDLISWD